MDEVRPRALLDERDLVRIEYEQIGADWRHRDAMLWQSFTAYAAPLFNSTCSAIRR